MRAAQAIDLFPRMRACVSSRSSARLLAAAPRNPSRIASKKLPSSRNSCARPSRKRMRARSGKTSVVTASATTMPSKTSNTRSAASLPARTVLMHQHNNGDGHAGQPRAVAQARAGRTQRSPSLRPERNSTAARQTKRTRNQARANQRSHQPIARSGHRGADIRLQHDDGADRAPIAVAPAECAAPSHQQSAAASAVLAAWISNRRRSQLKIPALVPAQRAALPQAACCECVFENFSRIMASLPLFPLLDHRLRSRHATNL